MSDQDPPEFDVIIIGLGPTGATLANLLGLCGVSVLVLEREHNIYPFPRAVHFDDEIMRVFQCIGITASLLEQVIVNRGMRFVDPEGQILLDWPRPQRVTNQGWHASYRFHQPDLELLLREALERHQHTKVLTGQLATVITDHAEYASVEAIDSSNGHVRTYTSRYLVGCDGARSSVRQAMQADMQSLGLAQRWLVLDVILNKNMPQLGDYTLQFCNPDRPMTYCRNPGDRRRWEFALHEDEADDEVVQEDNVWRLLQPWLDKTDAMLERKAVYTFESAVSGSFRSGRLLLAGDAAHLTPPFMGQGMCAGIRDAANLAWKLALSCQSEASSELLDTYQSERKPNVTAYIATAAHLGELINRMGEHANQTSDGHVEPPRMKSLKSTLGEGLGNSSDRLRGTLAPQALDVKGTLTDDHFGYVPMLLIDQSLHNDYVSANSSTTQDVSLQIINTDAYPAIKSILRDLGTRAVLVRPDRYILASASNLDELSNLMSRHLPFPGN